MALNWKTVTPENVRRRAIRQRQHLREIRNRIRVVLGQGNLAGPGCGRPVQQRNIAPGHRGQGLRRVGMKSGVAYFQTAHTVLAGTAIEFACTLTLRE